MRECQKCYSWEVNPGRNGRDAVSDIDLCDVCYWRKRAIAATAMLKKHFTQEDLTTRQMPWLGESKEVTP